MPGGGSFKGKAALKVFAAQLQRLTLSASQGRSGKTRKMEAFGQMFSKFWLQGVVVLVDDGAEGKNFVLDDGSGSVMRIYVPAEAGSLPTCGASLMVVVSLTRVFPLEGTLLQRVLFPSGDRALRDTLWCLEVPDVWLSIARAADDGTLPTAGESRPPKRQRVAAAAAAAGGGIAAQR
eukprot:g153.t1